MQPMQCAIHCGEVELGMLEFDSFMDGLSCQMLLVLSEHIQDQHPLAGQPKALFAECLDLFVWFHSSLLQLFAIRSVVLFNPSVNEIRRLFNLLDGDQAMEAMVDSACEAAGGKVGLV